MSYGVCLCIIVKEEKIALNLEIIWGTIHVKLQFCQEEFFRGSYIIAGIKCSSISYQVKKVLGG